MKPTYRLTLAQQLLLLVGGMALLATLSLGGLSLWNLRSGFDDYLQQRDEAELTRLARLVQSRSLQDPGLDWLRDQPGAMRALMDEFMATGRPPRRPDRPERPDRADRPDRPERPPPRPGDHPPHADPARPPHGTGGAHRPDGPPPRPEEFDGPPPPPRPGPPGRWADRVLIRDMQGRLLAGREAPAQARRSSQEVRVNGQVVAVIEMLAERELDSLEAHFLRRQSTGLLLATLLTLGLTLLVAWRLAGRWSRPLRALQQASQAIAQGDRQLRLQPAGAKEIAQLAQDMNRMAAELARHEGARQLWIAQISHELRTPLAVLQGELEAIEDGARKPDAALIARLHGEVLQLARLVNDLHTLSMADLGQLPCEFSSGQASDTLLGAAQGFELRAQQRGLQLHLQGGPPAAVYWDHGRIRQLLANLLDNSLRYTQAPGRIELSWQLQGSGEGALLLLRVQDSAPGVPEAALEQVFEPLFRADQARSRQAQQPHGSGLGLAIVRAIVRAHQGQVTARHSALGGLCLEVWLPLQAQDQHLQEKTHP